MLGLREFGLETDWVFGLAVDPVLMTLTDSLEIDGVLERGSESAPLDPRVPDLRHEECHALLVRRLARGQHHA